MIKNWLLRGNREFRSVERILGSASLPSWSEDDADFRRTCAEFAAIRARFPDHA